MGTVYELVHNDSDMRWHLELAGISLWSYQTKEEAFVRALNEAVADRAVGARSQLVVQRSDGSMAEYRCA